MLFSQRFVSHLDFDKMLFVVKQLIFLIVDTQ